MLISQKKVLLLALVAVMLVALMVSPAAFAACTDTPAPGVDCQRCYLDKRHFLEAE